MVEAINNTTLVQSLENGGVTSDPKVIGDLREMSTQLNNLSTKDLSPKDKRFVELARTYAKARYNGQSTENLTKQLKQANQNLEEQKQIFLEDAAGNPAAIAKVEEWAEINFSANTKLMELISNPGVADKKVTEELTKINEKPSYVAPEQPNLSDNSMGNKSLVAA